uniref:Uncharacterized protein n=1 Tax=Oryza glumipatula TaxID=40148 RepID=A0A0E0AT77_9ORYZ
MEDMLSFFPSGLHVMLVDDDTKNTRTATKTLSMLHYPAPPPHTPALHLRSELASAPPHQASCYPLPLLLPLLPPISTEAPRRLPSTAVDGIRYREEDEVHEDTVAVEMGMAM